MAGVTVFPHDRGPTIIIYAAEDGP